MESTEFLELIESIRRGIGLVRGIEPKILDILEDDTGCIHVLTTDRSEKHMILGPAGRVVTEAVKRTGRNVKIYSRDDVILREFRLKLVLSRINEILEHVNDMQGAFLERLKLMINARLKIPIVNHPVADLKETNIEAGVALSGGADSSASMIIIKRWGITPRPLIVDRGVEFLHPKARQDIVEFCRKLGVTPEFIPVDDGFSEVLEKTREGRIHPCGPCHEIVMRTVHRFSKKKGIQIIVTGESLPSGRQSLVLDDGILHVHIPAALVLTKYETRKTSEEYHVIHSKSKFGCSLLHETYQLGWQAIGPSIYRVLREVDAGFLSTAKALSLIRGIVKDHLKQEGNQ